MTDGSTFLDYYLHARTLKSVNLANQPCLEKTRKKGKNQGWSYATTYLLQTDNRPLFNLRLQMLLDALEPRVGLQIRRVAGAEMVWLGQMAAEHVVGCYAKRDGYGHAAAGVGAGVEHRHGGGWMSTTNSYDSIYV